MAELIRGQVAQILTSRELVINRGEQHGVQVGMRFAVLNRRGVAIVDPETGEQLDPVELEKTIVKVVRLYPRSSVARTFRTYRRAGLFSANVFAQAETVAETLRTEEHTAREELDESESYVKRGDPVVQFMGEEFLEK